MSILEVRKLTKHYKQVHAVNGISFSVKPGICFGLLGPNGAGKTTTIEMIEGITPPTSGEIFYKGKPTNQQFSHEAGIQFQQTSLMDYLTVRETLMLFASFYKKNFDLEKLISLCKLEEFLDQRSTKLSGGQKQRLLLAIALVNDPEIIFLDEPTTGLDPQSRRNFWDLITDIKQQGKTIILTTHYMDEAETLCDELIIIDQGKIIDEGTPKELLDKHFPCMHVTLDKEALHVSPYEFNDEIQVQENKVHFITQTPEKTIESLIHKGIDITSLNIVKPNLEDLFLKLTGHKLRQ